MLCGAGGVGESAEGWDGGGGGGVEANLGGKMGGDRYCERRKRRFSRMCCRAVDEDRTKEAVEFEERQRRGITCRVFCARVEDGQKKGGARQRLEPAEGAVPVPVAVAVPSPSSWSGLVLSEWMDGWQAGKDWTGTVGHRQVRQVSGGRQVWTGAGRRRRKDGGSRGQGRGWFVLGHAARLQALQPLIG